MEWPTWSYSHVRNSNEPLKDLNVKDNTSSRWVLDEFS
jgi:hypothetical protein